MIKNRIQVLVEQDRRVFRTKDLVLLWEVENRQTLLVTLSRYAADQKIFRIYKGLYSLVPPEKLDNYELGQALFGPLSYVTTETVLASEGVINQGLRAITFMGERAREYTIEGIEYICRFTNGRYLVNRAGIEQKKRYDKANLSRAVADMMHVAPDYYIDNRELVDWDEVEVISKKVGYIE